MIILFAVFLTFVGFSSIYSEKSVHDGPSYKWKAQSPALQKIVDELRQEESCALETIRKRYKVSLVEWNEFLKRFDREQSDFIAYLGLPDHEKSRAWRDRDVPDHILDLFEIGLAQFAISPNAVNISASDENYSKYDAGSQSSRWIAGSLKSQFFINTQCMHDVLWHYDGKSLVFHEITHTLEGHSVRRDLLGECFGIYCQHRSLVKIQEKIADILPAIYDHDIAKELHDSFLEKAMYEEHIGRSLRPIPYTSYTELSQYTEKIVAAHAAHEKEVYYQRLNFLHKAIFNVRSVITQTFNNAFNRKSVSTTS